MDAPTFYATVFEERLTYLRESADQEIDRATDVVRKAMKHLLDDVLERAYQAGLRDGFGQGVAAEAERSKAPR